MRTHLHNLAAITLFAMPAFAMSDSDLRAALEQRFQGDRTGACVAAAVIDNGTTASAYVCANPKSQRPYDEDTAFEIGSVTKTMTAALLAEFIARDEVTLNDPISKLLSPGTTVPSFDGRDIRKHRELREASTARSSTARISNFPTPFLCQSGLTNTVRACFPSKPATPRILSPSTATNITRSRMRKRTPSGVQPLACSATSAGP
jgi:hypothetical protein